MQTRLFGVGIMRAPLENVIRYFGVWLVAVAAVWSLLMVYGKENPWIDRLITGEIAVCGFFAAILIVRYTPKITVRTLGVFGLMVAIVLIFVAAQLLAAGIFGDPTPTALNQTLPDFPNMPKPATVPYWLRSTWRSILAVSGPCLLVGFYEWWHAEPTPPAL